MEERQKWSTMFLASVGCTQQDVLLGEEGGGYNCKVCLHFPAVPHWLNNNPCRLVHTQKIIIND